MLYMQMLCNTTSCLIRFIKQYLLMMGANQMATSAFRFIGGLTRDIINANALASFFTLATIVLSGFVITRGEVLRI
jgi:ABC-type multidrug transport system permease subunit